MSLFPDEDVLTREIETWHGFIDKLSLDEDKAILTKLLNDFYKYSVAINSHAEKRASESDYGIIIKQTDQSFKCIKTVKADRQ